MTLRIVFMGTPDFSVPTLRALAEAGHQIAAVYTQPPRPAGRRGLELTKSPVHRAAEELGLEVHTPTSLKDEGEQARFAALGADLAVVVAYGLILPRPVLEAPRLGCVNGHASLLPRWRGAAPIQRAVMAGDTETGICVMRMEAGLDTGPVGLVHKMPIGPDTTAGELHDALAELCARAMVEALDSLDAGVLEFTPQPADGITYASKIDKAEARVDWALPAQTVHDRIRGLSPFPGAWCEVVAGGRTERLKLLRSTLAEGAGAAGELLDASGEIACGEGAVRLLEVQRAGGKPASAADFVRGARLSVGDRLL